MFLRVIYIIACVRSLFLFIVEWYLITWIYHILFIYLPVDGYLDYYHFLAIMNNGHFLPEVQPVGRWFSGISIRESDFDFGSVITNLVFWLD